jgi:hypothetical protein
LAGTITSTGSSTVAGKGIFLTERRKPSAVDSRQHRPRVVGGGGEDDQVDGVLERLGVDLGRRTVLDGRDRREVLGVEAVDPSLRAQAADFQGAAADVGVQLNLVGRQGVDEVRQQPGRHRDRALFFHLGADPAGDGDLQVGGRQPQTRVVRRQQDIARDREGALGGDGPPDDGQSAVEVLLEARQLQRLSLERRV